jgi:NAD(P)-dependent dehydrogenase (short-subunit alcohol dehydrogenase family)
MPAPSQTTHSQDASSTIGHYQDLKNKTFLVTGASSGIGRAIAIALGKQGAKIILTGRNEERLAETAGHISSHTTILPADLTIETERNTLVGQLPTLDGVCHSAGIIDPFPIRYLDEQQFDKVFQINAVAPILLTSRLLGKKKFNDGASIVFISSVVSDRAMKGGSVYSTSKAAIESFSRGITLEHASKKMRSNCIRPALTETNILKQANELVKAAASENWLDEYKLKYPLGFGKPEDVAAATLFLLSTTSRWITGTTLTLDGGLSSQI